jgi:hypothetical protein
MPLSLVTYTPLLYLYLYLHTPLLPGKLVLSQIHWDMEQLKQAMLLLMLGQLSLSPPLLPPLLSQ